MMFKRGRREGEREKRTDDATPLLASDALDTEDSSAVLSLTIGSAATALLQVRLGVDALLDGRIAHRQSRSLLHAEHSSLRTSYPSPKEQASWSAGH